MTGWWQLARGRCLFKQLSDAVCFPTFPTDLRNLWAESLNRCYSPAFPCCACDSHYLNAKKVLLKHSEGSRTEKAFRSLFQFPKSEHRHSGWKKGLHLRLREHLHQCWYCQILCAELPMDTCRCTPRMHLLGLEQAFVLRELHSNNTSSWMPPPWQLQGSSVLSKGPTEHVEIYVHYKLYYMFMYIMHCLTWLSLFIYHNIWDFESPPPPNTLHMSHDIPVFAALACR